MKIEVGMYVRTKYGITQYKEYETSEGKLLCMPIFITLDDIINNTYYFSEIYVYDY